MCESYQKIKEILKESCDKILEDPRMELGFGKFEAIYGSREIKFATYSICRHMEKFVKIWLLAIPEILYERSQQESKKYSHAKQKLN